MSIMVIATLELQSPDLLEDWKKISDAITEDLKANAEGFISRESGQDEDGLLYCVLVWESREASEAFNESLPSRVDFAEMMAEFSRVIKVESMRKKVLTLV